MKRTVRACSGIVRGLAWMILALVLAGPAVRAKTEESFPVLRTKTATYTNVTVTTKDKSYIFILHAGGMGSIRIADLPNDVQEQLGYALPVDPALAKTNKSRFTFITEGTNGMAVFAKELSGLGDKLKPLQEEWQGRMEQADIQITPSMIYGGLAVLFAIYLFFCYCTHLICVKAAGSSSILVWVPLFQLIPLFRAAGMSSWWFLIFWLIPITPIAWAVNIARTRKKTLWTSFFLILPITTPFAFMYLAFSSTPKPPTPRYKSMALATA